MAILEGYCCVVVVVVFVFVVVRVSFFVSRVRKYIFGKEYCIIYDTKISGRKKRYSTQCTCPLPSTFTYVQLREHVCMETCLESFGKTTTK